MQVKIYWIIFLTCISSSAFSQVKYSTTDRNNIIKKRREQVKAMADWNQLKLYQLGTFHEAMYDKYKDTSMDAAIACYRIAASSESEYMDRKYSYAAAGKLGRIYEKGKGTPVSIHRAMIYYFLADPPNIGRYDKLGDPLHNKNFQRLKKSYCQRDTILFKGRGTINSNDSLVIGISPFCIPTGARIEAAFHSLAETMIKDPLKKIQVTIYGDNSIMAAQYSLKVNNEVLKSIYDWIVNYFLGGISVDRFLELRQELDENEEDYRLVITTVDE